MASISGSAGCAASSDLPIDQCRTSRMVPSRAAANTANGAIQATRLKPEAGGAARTVAPYFAANVSKIFLSVSPLAMLERSRSNSSEEFGQPTWLHSPRICAFEHLQRRHRQEDLRHVCREIRGHGSGRASRF